MGFNNFGSDFLKERISEYRANHIPIGINIGKNKDTPNEQGKDDYIDFRNFSLSLGLIDCEFHYDFRRLLCQRNQKRDQPKM